MGQVFGDGLGEVAALSEALADARALIVGPLPLFLRSERVRGDVSQALLQDRVCTIVRTPRP
ncbi:hypothetical protein AB1207_22405 [Kineococcus endophyticus]|uniref:Uncharacterized protein n=1 Tax=Kineococcus endophyticus TaxID=1181883 RepID=A0ABV3PDS7_9ACTN